MGKRDIFKTAARYREQQKNNSSLKAYDLSLRELAELTELALRDPAKAVSVAFDAGFIIGGRAKEKNRISGL